MCAVCEFVFFMSGTLLKDLIIIIIIVVVRLKVLGCNREVADDML